MPFNAPEKELESDFSPSRNLEASVRSRDTELSTQRMRDLIEAGLN
jgi:hypothetical protein